MDYKYIEQLLERYWNGETTLDEERILRLFFSQEDVPASLARYKDLFVYERSERKTDVLGDDFDARLLELVGEQEPVKARVVSIAQGLRPLFKAAAVVAIFITLGNAAQVPFATEDSSKSVVSVEGVKHEGPSVAQNDSARTDTLKHVSKVPDNKN